MVGFEVWDVNMNDLDKNSELLDDFRGIVFVGGFSYSDVFGAASGWYASIKFNKNISSQFDRFYNRQDTFSLGVCNGCQLMSKMGWIPKCRFLENKSERFESRFSMVKIKKNNSIMMKNMETCILGIWVAHGEGRFDVDFGGKMFYDYKEIYDNVCMNYVDDGYISTERYPYNPNGSVAGITGLCSDNGRHMAMMPHPERCFLKWQVPYLENCYDKIDNIFTPWFLMFKNLYDWCEKN
jgi:phosphoribosylformylglycinamidine synthase